MKRLILIAMVLLLSASTALAQLPCTADFNCDQNVDATDVSTFLGQFGRSPFNDPCPDCYDSPCPCTTQGDTCPYGMVDCGDRCVDPMIDEDACGADINCLGGTTCIAGEICEGGICILNCQSGLIVCSGQCVNPMTDENFCGASGDCVGGNGGTVCGAGEMCAGGVCDLNCPSGLTECAGTCVDTDTDEAHCSSCGTPCDSSEVCLAGNCELFCSDHYAPVPQTGQHTSYQDGDDGDLQKGVAWPNPRFTDNGDGTVTDNLTGLIWLKNANCFGQRYWSQAISDCNGLASGQCGLTDGSSVDDWRLPNRFELASLIDIRYWQPALSNSAGTAQWTHGDPFTNLITTDYYWSSTTSSFSIVDVWLIDMLSGYAAISWKTNDFFYVWPVRGGH